MVSRGQGSARAILSRGSHGRACRSFQEAWAKRELPTLHGCVYGIDDGLIKEIVQLDHNHPIDPVYKYSFPEHSLT